MSSSVTPKVLVKLKIVNLCEMEIAWTLDGFGPLSVQIMALEITSHLGKLFNES